MTRTPPDTQTPPKKLQRANRAAIDHTVGDWVMMTGRDQVTLLRGFRRCDFFPKPGELIPFKRVEAALFGEEYIEKVRGQKLDNEAKEREAKQESRELIPWSEVEPWIVQNYIQPMAGLFASMASDLAARCNPERPEVARAVIEAWIEQTVKPALKTGLEKPRKEK